MAEKLSIKTAEIMLDRFGKDMPISLATVADGEPQVRIVDGYYEDGAFYVITYALSDKIRQLEKHPRAAVCGEWFTGHGVGENLGYILDVKNAELFIRVREVFAGWLG
ncbi:MAG: pyridoxamine 5'-phosphate oxidase family protein, partial [Oscillospiraceae bacterium]|nr:pyridoxamine 5'-phosphate oxidase family protein [Oscillospiraceae bacterium]